LFVGAMPRRVYGQLAMISAAPAKQSGAQIHCRCCLQKAPPMAGFSEFAAGLQAPKWPVRDRTRRKSPADI
jgi:hypothetical protein